MSTSGFIMKTFFLMRRIIWNNRYSIFHLWVVIISNSRYYSFYFSYDGNFGQIFRSYLLMIFLTFRIISNVLTTDNKIEFLQTIINNIHSKI